jgi:predicted hotdog family 3-hydroxylacyl-ACP dehydratase
MCLLEKIISWDAKQVICSTQSHQLKNNPLRSEGELNAIHAIEYGAQAVAVHGGLLAFERGEAIKPGYLAAVRQVKLHQSRLDSITSPLTVEAIQMLCNGGNLVYSFSISADNQAVADGRVTVMMRPEEST